MSDDYRKIQGRIFDIQKYSIHDGPGIRTIVFPEGLSPSVQMVLQPGISDPGYPDHGPEWERKDGGP